MNHADDLDRAYRLWLERHGPAAEEIAAARSDGTYGQRIDEFRRRFPAAFGEYAALVVFTPGFARGARAVDPGWEPPDPKEWRTGEMFTPGPPPDEDPDADRSE